MATRKPNAAAPAAPAAAEADDASLVGVLASLAGVLETLRPAPDAPDPADGPGPTGAPPVQEPPGALVADLTTRVAALVARLEAPPAAPPAPPAAPTVEGRTLEELAADPEVRAVAANVRAVLTGARPGPLVLLKREFDSVTTRPSPFFPGSERMEVLHLRRDGDLRVVDA